MPRFNPHARHSDLYYLSVGNVLIHSHKTGKTGRQIVEALQATGLPSPTGSPWTLDSYKSLLARIRSQAGNTFNGLLRGLLAGHFTREDVRLLMGRL